MIFMVMMKNEDQNGLRIMGEIVDHNHPAIQTWTSFVLRDTGHLKKDDIDQLLEFFKYINPENKEYYSPKLAEGLDRVLSDAKIRREIEQETQKREPNPTLNFDLQTQTELLKTLREVYRTHQEKNALQMKEGILPNFWPEKRLFELMQGVVAVRKLEQQRPAIETLAAIVQRDTGHLTEDQINDFIAFLGLLEPGNKDYNAELVKNLDKMLRDAMENLNRNRGNRESNPTFNFSLPLQTKLLDRLREAFVVNQQSALGKQLMDALQGAIDIRKAMQQIQQENEEMQQISEDRTGANSEDGNLTERNVTKDESQTRKDPPHRRKSGKIGALFDNIRGKPNQGWRSKLRKIANKVGNDILGQRWAKREERTSRQYEMGERTPR